MLFKAVLYYRHVPKYTGRLNITFFSPHKLSIRFETEWHVRSESVYGMYLFMVQRGLSAQ